MNPLFQEVTAVPNPKAHIGQLCLEAKETKTVSTEPSANFITGGEKKGVITSQIGLIMHLIGPDESFLEQSQSEVMESQCNPAFF